MEQHLLKILFSGNKKGRQIHGSDLFDAKDIPHHIAERKGMKMTTEFVRNRYLDFLNPNNSGSYKKQK
jgi:hypothetical protein